MLSYLDDTNICKHPEIHILPRKDWLQEGLQRLKPQALLLGWTEGKDLGVSNWIIASKFFFSAKYPPEKRRGGRPCLWQRTSFEEQPQGQQLQFSLLLCCTCSHPPKAIMEYIHYLAYQMFLETLWNSDIANTLLSACPSQGFEVSSHSSKATGLARQVQLEVASCQQKGSPLNI